VLDRELVTRFADGDADAVRAVYREYGKLVFAVAYKVLSDRGLAEEATQQAFLQAWRSSSRFDVSRELGPWLATIARRAAIDVHRREARRVHESIDDANPTDPALVTLPVSAEKVYDVWEIRRAIDELPPEEAALVRLQHLDGYSHSEIAEQLRIPVGTVKSRIFRAHRRLAGQLGHLRGDGANGDEPTTAEERTHWIQEKPR
jgi:RNA polymerase sigma-70 factor, ECF subfamily